MSDENKNENLIKGLIIIAGFIVIAYFAGIVTCLVIHAVR